MAHPSHDSMSAVPLLYTTLSLLPLPKGGFPLTGKLDAPVVRLPHLSSLLRGSPSIYICYAYSESAYLMVSSHFPPFSQTQII